MTRPVPASVFSDRDDAIELGRVRARVRRRAELPLLFAAPQREPDRPPRRLSQRRDRAGRLEHHRDAGGVVLRAGSEVPGVEVRADDHPLVGTIAARDVGDHVVDRGGARRDPVDQLERHPHGAVGKPARESSAHRRGRSARPAAREIAVLNSKPRALSSLSGSLSAERIATTPAARKATARRAARSCRRVEIAGRIAIRQQHDAALQRRRAVEARPARTSRARRPRPRIRRPASTATSRARLDVKRTIGRRDDPRARRHALPSAFDRERLERDPRDPHRAELIRRPVGGALIRGRTGQSRADRRQLADVLERLSAADARSREFEVRLRARRYRAARCSAAPTPRRSARRDRRDDA